MRELKFRAWDKVEKKMLFGADPFAIHVSGSNEPLLAKTHKNEDCIFEQYTGLKGKNGKEIYEGDILHSKVGINYAVSYNDCNGRFEMWSKDGYGGGIADVQYIKEFDIKVIGNIHENPELLGDTNVANKEGE